MTSSNTGPDFCPINLHSLESWDKDLASLASISSWESFPRSWPLTSPQIIFQDIEFCWLSAASPFLEPKKEKNALERKTLTKLRWHRADCTDEDLKAAEVWQTDASEARPLRGSGGPHGGSGGLLRPAHWHRPPTPEPQTPGPLPRSPREVDRCQFSSVQFSRSVVSDSLRPHESQHARPPCPSPTPRVHSDSRPQIGVPRSKELTLLHF